MLKNNFTRFYKVTAVFVVIIVITALISYYLERRKAIRRDPNASFTFIDFLNNHATMNLQDLLIGVSFGIMFGFIDNFGIYVGMETLEDILKDWGFKGPEIAGWANTYSDVLGALLGSFFSTIISDTVAPDFDQNTVPIWSNTIGILIGCILGIYVPKLVFGLFGFKK